MDQTALEKKLWQAARRDAPSTEVPFSFEKRVMAHVRARAISDRWSDWSRALWRAAAPCAAIALLLGTWTFLVPDTAIAQDEFAQHFESTVLAGFSSEQGFE